jgi:cytoskeletal protein CcmA (bactofilin family)
MNMKKQLLIFLIAIFSLPFFSSMAEASVVKTEDNVIIAEDEIVEGDLYTFSQTVTIDGIVTGDLISFGRSIYINGQVLGDIIAFCESIELKGSAEDDVRAFARNITINGTINKNVTAFSEKLLFNQEGMIGEDAYFFCAEAYLRGKNLGSVSAMAGRVHVAGEIEKDLDIQADSALIASTAHIKGNLKICCAREAEIDPAAVIGGNVEEVPPKCETEKVSKWVKPSFYIFKLIWLIGAIIIGVLAVKLLPKLTQMVAGEAQQYWKSLGIGFLTCVFTPVASIIIAVTVVGLPLGLLSLTFYAVLLYLSTIFVGIVVGMLILRFFNKPFEISLLALVVGLLALHILFQVPYLGMVVRIITLILGLGIIVSGSFKFLREAA